MNKKSTPNLQNNIIAQALCTEDMPKPSEISLAFIRNFAYNFRVLDLGGGLVQDFMLN